MIESRKLASNYSNSIERPLTSSIATSIPKIGEQRISAKKLQHVQEWLNDQIIKRSEINNNNNNNKNVRFAF
jgi:hypothetical protein